MIDRFLQTGLVLCSLLLALWLARTAWGEGESPESEVESLAADIQVLQPRVSDGRALRLASIIRDACAEHGIPPRLVVAMVMRESSFDPRVESLERLGPRGEIGLLQVMPASPALAMRPDGCTEALEGAECQIEAGVAWLAHARETCPGSTWRWVAAYGSGRCLPESRAAVSRGVVRLRGILGQLGGEEEW
jgi:hypothetical protein